MPRLIDPTVLTVEVDENAKVHQKDGELTLKFTFRDKEEGRVIYSSEVIIYPHDLPSQVGKRLQDMAQRMLYHKEKELIR